MYKDESAFSSWRQNVMDYRQIKNERLNKQLDWLLKLSEGLKTLKTEEFNYESYVSSYVKNETLCGTVCCAFGWMPKFVPEANVKWFNDRTFSDSTTVGVTIVAEVVFSELKQSEISFMFYGRNLLNKNFMDTNLYGDGYDADLGQVIKRIDLIIKQYFEKSLQLRMG